MEPTKNHLHVEFFEDTKENKRKSAEAGRPIFDTIEKARIRFVGDKHNVLVVPANSTGQMRDEVTGRRLTYAEQFPEHYRAFKEKREFVESGTPLEELPFITKAKAKELSAFNIHTAEALAALDGSALQKLGMGARDLKNKAQAYIDQASGSADVVRLSSENEAMKQQLQEMQEQLRALQKTPAQNAPAQSDPETASAVDVSNSPFADWDDETIVKWIVEQGGEKPHHKCSHDTLVAKADELNAVLKKRNEAA